MPSTFASRNYLLQSTKRLRIALAHNVSLKRPYHRPTFAPKPVLDLKHIRQNPGLYETNCIQRNYPNLAKNAWRVLDIHKSIVDRQQAALGLRQRNNALGEELKKGASLDGGETLIRKARALKEQLAGFEKSDKEAQKEMQSLALELPNLSSLETPVGSEAAIKGYVGGEAPSQAHIAQGTSHVEIGRMLDIIDFEASSTTSGWGWYFLKNGGALLEQALIQYALSVAMKRGWKVMTPPSLVYSHIASACGFMPRDQNGETQIYSLASQGSSDGADNYSLVLAGTAEIPFAASKADKILSASDLPLKVIGPSRCYRAEAGARGVDTKGLYRVHEFTKVEMFAWVQPADNPSDGSSRFGSETSTTSQADEIFDELLSIQKEIIESLGLHARILEMPTTDLGASATRKVDIEAFFPSRTSIDGGYGEVSSASMCTDYQTRRMNTRLKSQGAGGLDFPWTMNGTAVAVPRVLAAIIENGWDGRLKTVRVPECLRRWMPGEGSFIQRGV